MSLINRSMYAILGILSVAPGTGYDIKKYSDQVLAFFWNENFGHIYPTLKKMLEKGTIEIVDRPHAGSKIVYGITEKGRKEFEAWLAEYTAPQPVRSEFMLKLLFSSTQPRESVAKKLENYKAQHEEKMRAYESMQSTLLQGIEEVSKERLVYLNAVLRRGILSSEATIRWCDETIKALREDPAGGRQDE